MEHIRHEALLEHKASMRFDGLAYARDSVIILIALFVLQFNLADVISGVYVSPVSKTRSRRDSR